MSALRPPLAPMVKGWCPGALRPMASGDGLIVRLRFEAARLPLATAHAVAGLARRFGNGGIDLTGRANLQVRGCSEETLPTLHEALAELGLLDESAEAEAARNVLSSPFAGEDPAAKVDIRPVVAALGQWLAGDPAARRLPAKFGWMVEADGLFPLTGAVADVRFFALDARRYRLDLASSAGWQAAGMVAEQNVPGIAARLAAAFLALPGRPGRMARATDAERAELIAGLGLAPAPARGEPVPVVPIGPVPHAGAPFAIGAGIPYGRLEAEALDRLAAIAAEAGAEALHLTPFRALMFRCGDAGEALARLADAGFITDPADPRRRIAACTGAPGCASGTVATRELAEAIAPHLPGDGGEAGIAVHISGCAKGCAHPAAAPLALVGQADGRIGIVRGGRPDAAPSRLLGPDDLHAQLPALLGGAHG